jgi:hypothetical protein
VGRSTALVAAAAGFLLFPAPAFGQLPCGPQLATAGGTAWTCPLGGIRNIVDIEGGSVAYENGQLDRPKLDLNISSGEHEGVRSRVAINPDVGGPGTVIFDGRRNRIASFYPESIDLYAPVTFHAGTGLDYPPAAPQPGVQRLRRRVLRLERRVVRLRSVLRRVLQGRP